MKGGRKVSKDDSNTSGKYSYENGDDNDNSNADVDSDGDKVVQPKKPNKDAGTEVEKEGGEGGGNLGIVL